MLEQHVPEGLHPIRRTHVGQVHGTVSHWWDPMLEQGKSVRSPPPEEKGAAETRCDELTATPFPIPLCHLWGRR